MSNNKENIEKSEYGFISKVCFTVGIILCLMTMVESVLAGLTVLSFFAAFGFAFVKNSSFKKTKIISCIAGMFVFAGAYGGQIDSVDRVNTSNRSTENVSTKTIHSQPRQLNAGIVYPENQKWLSQVVNHYYQEYKKQPNELAKTDMRFQRAKFLEKSGLNSFDEWYFKVDRISTVMGKAHVRLAYDKILMTFEVEPGTNEWEAIKSLNEGKTVKVSGVFDKNMFDKDDYFYETSLTELGSMEQPNFVVKVSKLSML